MTTMIKTRSVLTVSSVAPYTVRLASHDEDNGGLDRMIQISKQDWDDMGRPAEITLTIEPGDKLNEAR